MKTHTTITLRKLIVQDMDTTKNQMTSQEIEVWIQTLPEINEEMYKHLHFFGCSIFNDDLIKRQIQQVQKECIYLLNILDKYVPVSDDLAKLKIATINCLDLILEKVDNDYSKYADTSIKMSKIHFRKNQETIKSQNERVIAGFKKHNIEQKLQNVILECMYSLLKAESSTYSRMNLVLDLQLSMISICSAAKHDYISSSLIQHLLSVNYNTVTFIDYYQQKIRDDLSEMYVVTKKLDHLFDLQRDFSTRLNKKSVSIYDPQRRRPKEIMLNFVNAEITCLNRKQSQHEVRPVPALPASNANTQGYKIRTAISVDALAYLIKLMIAAKAIEPGVKSELFGFVAGIFQTPGTGTNGISPKSIQNKYQAVVQSTAMSIRALLVRMLKILDDEFHPV